MGILSWIILGLCAGVLAKWIMPGARDIGPVLTILLGIGGARPHPRTGVWACGLRAEAAAA